MQTESHLLTRCRRDGQHNPQPLPVWDLGSRDGWKRGDCHCSWCWPDTGSSGSSLASSSRLWSTCIVPRAMQHQGRSARSWRARAEREIGKREWKKKIEKSGRPKERDGRRIVRMRDNSLGADFGTTSALCPTASPGREARPHSVTGRNGDNRIVSLHRHFFFGENSSTRGQRRNTYWWLRSVCRDLALLPAECRYVINLGRRRRKEEKKKKKKKHNKFLSFSNDLSTRTFSKDFKLHTRDSSVSFSTQPTLSAFHSTTTTREDWLGRRFN